MRKLSIALLAVSLAGCASAPKPQVMPHKAVQQKAAKAAAPVEQPTPNQSLKKRWGYFQIPKWLHK